MARYIDADMLIKVIDVETKFCNIILTPKLIDDYANRHPADVQPVIHSKWEHCDYTKKVNNYGEVYTTSEPSWICEECRCANDEPSDYCPNCGAVMWEDTE